MQSLLMLVIYSLKMMRENENEKAMKSNNVTVGYRKIEEEAPKLCDFKKSIEQPFDTFDQSLQDDKNSNKSILNVSKSGVITVKMTKNATKSHSVMPEGLQSNVNIDEQVFNTSSVKELSTSDKENQSNSGAIDVSMKKLEKTDENSNENAKQKIVLKEI